MRDMPKFFFLFTLVTANAVGVQPKEETLRFPSAIDHLSLSMRHLAATGLHRGPPVLILHGSTFPSANASAWKIDGRSWMDELATSGYDVYALDFLGYGKSDHYPEMASDNPLGSALGDVSEMTDQVGRAVDQILKINGGSQVSLIGHSAGTFSAGRFTELHPERIARLVLYGAPTPTISDGSGSMPSVRYFEMSEEDQLESFELKVRQTERLDMGMFHEWAEAYLATDASRYPHKLGSVRVPSGMQAADDAMGSTGQLPYDPARIARPTLVIQAEWDAATSPAQGLWLFNQLSSPLKRFVLLSEGGHRVLLEKSRFQLCREVEAFLYGGDDLTTRPVPVTEVKSAKNRS